MTPYNSRKMSVNLTPQKSAVFSVIVGKTDTFGIKELAVVGKTAPLKNTVSVTARFESSHNAG